MKIAQHIIIHFFLLGMLLTVVQYLPVLEEETSTHLTELTKKAKEPNSSDNSGEDEDAGADDDVQTDLFFTHMHTYAFVRTVQNRVHIKEPSYQSLSASINTPPPKV